jgi:hypothetical protein
MFILLVRALCLKDEITHWVATYGKEDKEIEELWLSDQDWVHVTYLIVLLRPYFIWTEAFSHSSGVTINTAWMAYTDIFRHLEKYNALLRGTGQPWKVPLANCLGVAHKKLSEYYSRTDGPRGLLYNLASVLDPTKKLSLYNGNGFEVNHAQEYEAEFRQFHDDFYSHLCEQVQSEPPGQVSLGIDLTSIAIAKRRQSMPQSTSGSVVDKYLRSSLTTEFNPLEFWEVHEPFMPSLAQMAKDVLAIPVAGVGVERIFSIARQICSYQRNHLDAETIMQLMIVRSYDQLMAGDEPDNKRNTARLKKKVGFSRVDNKIAEAQEIPDPLVNNPGIAGPVPIASVDTTVESGRKGRGRKRL